MAKNCLNHPNEPAVTMCNQCHKPICKSCVMVTPQGSFCSTECSIVYREMKQKMGPAPEKSSKAKVVAVFLMLIILAAFAIHFVARGSPGSPLRKFDVIGRFVPYPQ